MVNSIYWPSIMSTLISYILSKSINLFQSVDLLDLHRGLLMSIDFIKYNTLKKIRDIFTNELANTIKMILCGVIIDFPWILFIYYSKGSINLSDIIEIAWIGTLPREIIQLNIAFVIAEFCEVMIGHQLKHYIHKICTWIINAVILTPDTDLHIYEKFNDGSTLTAEQLLNAFREVQNRSHIPEIHYYIIHSPVFNMFTIPYNKELAPVFIYSGIIDLAIRKCDNNPERALNTLQAVVAHELGHVSYAHAQKKWLEQFVVLAGMYISPELYIMLKLFFERRHEYQADDIAKQWGYKEGLKDFFQMLTNDIPDYPSGMQEKSWVNYISHSPAAQGVAKFCDAVTEWKSTHPTLAMRISHLTR